MLIGYARCSTADQNLDLQRDALKSAGCERIYEDFASGAKADRPGLVQALNQCRPGDSLVVWKLDRLGRSLKQIIHTVDDLSGRHVEFRSLTEGFDTSSNSGRLVFHIIASLSQMERELIRERTVAGLAAARQRGRIGGRRPILHGAKLEAAKKLLDDGTPVRDVAKVVGCSRATLYRHIPAKADPDAPKFVAEAQ
jgi:DNA invertase Pin-like site-specific DNA recombinase